MSILLEHVNAVICETVEAGEMGSSWANQLKGRLATGASQAPALVVETSSLYGCLYLHR